MYICLSKNMYYRTKNQDYKHCRVVKCNKYHFCFQKRKAVVGFMINGYIHFGEVNAHDIRQALEIANIVPNMAVWNDIFVFCISIYIVTLYTNMLWSTY